MARTDLSYEEFIDYRPAVAEPADFDTFWNDTIAEARAFDLDMQLRPVETPYRTVEIHDASFGGDGLSHQRLAQINWLNRLIGFASAS